MTATTEKQKQWYHRLPRPSTVVLTVKLVVGLVVTWAELEILVIFYIWGFSSQRWLFLAGLVVFTVTARADLAEEFRDDVRTTCDRYLHFVWRVRSPEKWGYKPDAWPSLTGRIEFGEFVGWPAALVAIIRARGRAIPFNPVTFTVRRPNDKGHTRSGNDAWLADFADWLKRRYRFTLAAPRPHPEDSNRDLIELRSQVIPDLIEAE